MSPSGSRHYKSPDHKNISVQGLQTETHPISITEAVRGLEVSATWEFLRLQKMQQGPQLFDAVLKGGAGHEKLVAEEPLRELLDESIPYISQATSIGPEIFASELRAKLSSLSAT